MIEELLLWLWLFLRVSGFVQQVNQAEHKRLCFHHIYRHLQNIHILCNSYLSPSCVSLLWRYITQQ